MYVFSSEAEKDSATKIMKRIHAIKDISKARVELVTHDV